MEIGDIKKVANRKRMNTEVEKLREKVAQETTKIIKLKVAQDTAYWDLKEKLQQVENNHERLQQNMVEVQMQHEAISGQYQDELRLRPETLNKLSSTREICDVLEDYSERLKETLSRCKTDQIALYDAYQKSGQLVRDIKFKQQQADEKANQMIESLQDKLNITSNHQNQLLQFFTAAKQQTESELSDVKAKLTVAQTQKDELLASVAELNRSIDKYKNDLMKRDEMNTNLQEEIKRNKEEYNHQCSEARNIIAKQERQIKEASEAYASLKQALSNQEQFTQSVCGERNALQEKVAALEEEQQGLVAAMNALKMQLVDASTANTNKQQQLEKLTEEKNNLEKDLFDYVQQSTNSKQQIQDLQTQKNTLANEKLDIAQELRRAVEDSERKSAKIEELISEENVLKKKITQTENAFNSYREATEDKINTMQTKLQNKDKEIDSKAATINLLMSEVKAGTDARSQLEGTVQKLNKDLEAEREAGKEKEGKLGKQIEHLETSVRDKEDELSKQMSIILEMRNEKERLLDKIQGMQQTIDNIQKELTGRLGQLPQAQRDPPEMDDNAVMLSPSNEKNTPNSPIIQKKPKFAVPRTDPKQLESMVFNLFSDSSVDGDTIDESDVERRFAALSRGERVAPKPLAAFKRRSRLMPANAPLSISQVRNELKTKERTFFKHKRVDKNEKVK
ncbi:unnamed protein product [Parnassius apollo]|uniref:(apollo) hypothetical protein n=1 Tax=Parnassius apollo TaxID=110799 RepID=A0A8S3X6C9_PARAO|nr:unnamed protein product [Parnassius apollo]